MMSSAQPNDRLRSRRRDGRLHSIKRLDEIVHPGSRPETDLREVEQPPDQLMKRIGDMFARRNRGHHTDHDEQH